MLSFLTSPRAGVSHPQGVAEESRRVLASPSCLLALLLSVTALWRRRGKNDPENVEDKDMSEML